MKKPAPEKRISRRKFLSAAAAGTAVFSIVPRHVVGGPGQTPPSEKINIAIIGAGGQGFTNTKGLLSHLDAQIVAVADPVSETSYSRFYYGGSAGRDPVAAYVDAENDKRLDKSSGKQAMRCSKFIDYREMFEKMGKDIDAVLIATPDHGHAVITMASLELGKHTFCEKPLTHSISEARAIRKAAKKANVTTQMGNFGHCNEGFALGVEWMQNKELGQLKEICSWSAAGAFEQTPERPQNKVEIPSSMENWDLWIGPAEYRDYHPAYAPFNWRGWWDFGGGGLGDMACHNLDQAFAAFDLDDPDKIECEMEWKSKESASTSNKVTYHCPAKGDRPAVKLTWYDGKRWAEARPAELEAGREFDGNGVWVRYEKGTILCKGWADTPRLIPESAMQSFVRPPKTMPRAKGGHHRDWLDAIKENRKSLADFDYSARLTEFVLLGVLAMRVGQTIEWNAKKMKITNIPDANNLVHPKYRKGWSL